LNELSGNSYPDIRVIAKARAITTMTIRDL
jgi:hypothetical protein